MKHLIIALVAASAFFSATSYADEAFDKLKALAATPKADLTATNAMQVVDAGIAVTNGSSLVNAVDLKLVPVSDILAKTKGKPEFVGVQCHISLQYGTDAEKVEAFNNAVDLFTKVDEDRQRKICNDLIRYAVWDVKNDGCMSKVNNEAFTTAVEKIATSSAKHKWNAVCGILYIWNKKNYSNNIDLAAKYAPSITEALKAENMFETWPVLDFINYLLDVKDFDSAKEILRNPKWFSAVKHVAHPPCPITSVIPKVEPEISAARKEFISKISTNERGMIAVAKVQDKVDRNKDATAKLCWPRLENPANKIEVALYLGDTDKLIDTLTAIDDTIDAKTINKAITVINALDPDYRSADVLKALRVINKKYTLKLYDDRDVWEPVLSKVRALIDTYNS